MKQFLVIEYYLPEVKILFYKAPSKVELEKVLKIHLLIPSDDPAYGNLLTLGSIPLSYTVKSLDELKYITVNLSDFKQQMKQFLVLKYRSQKPQKIFFYKAASKVELKLCLKTPSEENDYSVQSFDEIECITWKFVNILKFKPII